MSDAVDRLRALVVGLSPIHSTVARFSRGGPGVGREVEKLFRELSEIEFELHDEDDDSGFSAFLWRERRGDGDD